MQANNKNNVPTGTAMPVQGGAFKVDACNYSSKSLKWHRIAEKANKNQDRWRKNNEGFLHGATRRLQSVGHINTSANRWPGWSAQLCSPSGHQSPPITTAAVPVWGQRAEVTFPASLRLRSTLGAFLIATRAAGLHRQNRLSAVLKRSPSVPPRDHNSS